MTIWSIRVRGQPYQLSPFIDTDLIFEKQVLINPYAAETALVPTETGCNTKLSRGPVKDYVETTLRDQAPSAYLSNSQKQATKQP